MPGRPTCSTNRCTDVCNHCSQDPRDALGEAEAALMGLCIMLNQQPRDESIGAHDVAAVLRVIHDRLRPAVDAIQNYVPRT